MSGITEQATLAGRPTPERWDQMVIKSIRAFARHRDTRELSDRLGVLLELAETSNIRGGRG